MYETNKGKAYALIFSQCNKALQIKLMSRTDFETAVKGKPIELLDAIEKHAMSYMEHKYDAAVVLDSFRNLINLKQKEDEDLVDYTRRFKSARDVMESHVGTKLYFKKMAKDDPDWDQNDPDNQQECYNKAYHRFIAQLYLENGDQTKYGSILKGLASQYALKQDQYPMNLTHAMSILSDHKFDSAYHESKKKRKEKAEKEKDKEKKSSESEVPTELNFSQLEGACNCCGKKGHMSPKCPHKDKPKSEWAINKTLEAAFIQSATQSNPSDTQSTVSAPPAISNTMATRPLFGWMSTNVVFNQSIEDMKNWVLLDTGSTVHVFCNQQMVKGIRDSPTNITINTNGGQFTATKKATLPCSDIKVWFDANCITNVLSFSLLQEKFRITYDNMTGDIFNVFTNKGVLQFTQLSKYLYVFKPDLGEQSTKKEANLLNTLEESKRFFTPRQIKRAKAARNLSRAIGCPSDNDLKAILKMNTIKDCPIVEEDIKLAEKIFGKNIGIIKGKTTRKTPMPVVHDKVEIPHELRMAQYEVTLCIDTFFVNKMAFFHTISDKIAYRTSQLVPDQTLETYKQTLDLVFKIYQQAGFKIEYVCANREFEPLLSAMKNEYGFLPNIASAQEHVPIVKRSIRVVKEQCRATIHSNPFKALPRVLIKSVMQECTRKLNYFPVKGGCSPYYSPQEIMHELKLNYKQCSIPQLSYVLAHDEPNPTNTTQLRALDGIYMQPLSNAQGGHEILHLDTNDVIVRRNVTVIPITSNVIAAVEKLAKRDDMKPFKMTTKHGVILYDASTAGVDDEDEENEIEFVNDEDDDDIEEDEEDEEEQGDEMDPNEIYEENYDGNVNPVEADDANDEIDENENASSNQSNDHSDQVEEDDLAGDQQPVLRRSTRAAVPRQPLNIGTTTGQTYTNISPRAKDVTLYQYKVSEAYIFAMIMCRFNKDLEIKTNEIRYQHVTTYSLKKGIDKFGTKAKEAATKEMKQLHDRKCFMPINKEELKQIERKRALESLIFLTEKKDGTIKAHHCANGSTQRDYMQREDTSSPTVSTESTLLTAVIKAQENRDVATIDIPNAFIQTEVDEVDKDGNKTIMKIRGVLVDILCELDPTYKEYVVYEGKQKVLYLHVLKAIYGMLISSMLFYKKLSEDLVKYGFEINPYDPCVANKIVNGEQMTVSWHVDNLKASHKESKTIDEFIQWVKMTYGSIGQVKVTRGKVHQYLGMKLDYTQPGQVSF